MNSLLYIFLCVFICKTIYSKPVVKPEQLPIDVQKHIDAIQSACVSNDWVTVVKEYGLIDWKEIKKPAKVLKILSKDLKGNKDIKDLRKEIKTKYKLLRENDDADLDDNIEEIPIPIIKISIQKFPSIEIDQLDLIVIDISKLEYVDQLDISKYSKAIVVFKIRDENFIATMELWEKRYNKILDYYDDKGNKIIPAPGTTLWLERKAVIAAVEAGGDYDRLWDAYHQHFQKAVGRRTILKNKK